MAYDVQALHNQFGHRGEHPEHPVSDWRHEIADDNTRLGYWDWVSSRLEEAGESEPLSLNTMTSEDADRSPWLGDQFLENWANDAVHDGSADPEYELRNQEWETARPLFVASPTMMHGLQAILELGRRGDASSGRLCSQLAGAILTSIHSANSCALHPPGVLRCRNLSSLLRADRAGSAQRLQSPKRISPRRTRYPSAS